MPSANDDDGDDGLAWRWDAMDDVPDDWGEGSPPEEDVGGVAAVSEGDGTCRSWCW